MKRNPTKILIFVILTFHLQAFPGNNIYLLPDVPSPVNSHEKSFEPDLKNIRFIPDLYFECFIAEINKSCEIPLFFDSLVREYIEIYLLERTAQIPLLDARSEIFFPVFEKYLSEFHLPQELKYLPVIESGLQCKALSPSGALGLWQLIIETGRSCGLTITEDMDERINPEASTCAACRYLARLYKIFGNWQLCLLAYHAGPATIKNAIIKAGGKTNYKDIFPHLPKATQRYLPAFIASIYVLRNYKTHLF